jgi:hypothetical protein
MHNQRQRGILLVLAAVMIVIVSSIAATLLAASLGGSRREAARTRKFKSREIAEAGLDLSLGCLRQATDGVDNDVDGVVDEGIDADDIFYPGVVLLLEGNLGRLGCEAWTAVDDANGNRIPDFGETHVAPVPLSGGECFVYSVFSENDAVDNDEDGSVDEDDEAGSVTLIAQARYGGFVSTLRYTGMFTEKLKTPDTPLWSPRAAFAAGGDLRVTGHCSIFGDEGNVHSNKFMDLGGACTVTGDATSSGGGNVDASNVGGTVNTAADKIEIPDINKDALEALRDGAAAEGKDVYVLGLDGSIKKNGVLVSSGGVYHGWKFANDWWQVSGGAVDLDGVFYTEANVHITACNRDLDITVLAEGNISLNGNGKWEPYYEKFFLVSLKDVLIAGTPQESGDIGVILAREQVKTSGTAFVRGIIMAADLDDTGSFITETLITGNFDIEYNGEYVTPIPIVDPGSNRYKFDPTFSAYEER